MTQPMTMPFGKYKGTPLTEIDSGYLHWLTDNIEEWHPPLRAAVEAERARRKGVPSPAPATPAYSAPADRNPRRSAPTPTRHVNAGATCGICGLGATPERPLVHASCAADDVPF